MPFCFNGGGTWNWEGRRLTKCEFCECAWNRGGGYEFCDCTWNCGGGRLTKCEFCECELNHGGEGEFCGCTWNCGGECEFGEGAWN